LNVDFFDSGIPENPHLVSVARTKQSFSRLPHPLPSPFFSGAIEVREALRNGAAIPE
jgi:hypothetical protein